MNSTVTHPAASSSARIGAAEEELSAKVARSAPLTRRFKAAYGFGSMADGIVAAGFGFFLLFYLTAVCGMSGTLAGTAKLIALLVDAVADPAIGLASDRARSRLGRRLPFMIGSLLPFALALACFLRFPLFSPEGNNSCSLPSAS